MALIVNCCEQTQTVIGDADFPMEISLVNKTLKKYKCRVCDKSENLMMGKFKKDTP